MSRISCKGTVLLFSHMGIQTYSFPLWSWFLDVLTVAHLVLLPVTLPEPLPVTLSVLLPVTLPGLLPVTFPILLPVAQPVLLLHGYTILHVLRAVMISNCNILVVSL